MLGVCLGAQLLAEAAGGRVVRGERARARLARRRAAPGGGRRPGPGLRVRRRHRAAVAQLCGRAAAAARPCSPAARSARRRSASARPGASSSTRRSTPRSSTRWLGGPGPRRARAGARRGGARGRRRRAHGAAGTPSAASCCAGSPRVWADRPARGEHEGAPRLIGCSRSCSHEEPDMTDARPLQNPDSAEAGARPAHRLLGRARPHDPAGDGRDLRRVGEPPAAEHRQLDGDEHQAAREPGDPRRRPRRSSPTSSTRTSTSSRRSRASCRRSCSRSPRPRPARRATSSTTSPNKALENPKVQDGLGERQPRRPRAARERRRGQGRVHDDHRQHGLSRHHADPHRRRGADRPPAGGPEQDPARTPARSRSSSPISCRPRSRVAKGLKTADWFLRVLIALGFGLAIWLARGRRSQALVASGHRAGRRGPRRADHPLDRRRQRSSTASRRRRRCVPAATAAWDIGTELITTLAWSTIFVGIPAIIVGLLLGPNGWAKACATGWRRVANNRPEILYGGAVAIVLFLIVWEPVPATRRCSRSSCSSPSSSAGPTRCAS